MGILGWYFKDTDEDRVLRDFIARGAFDLYIEAESGTGPTQLDRWSGFRMGTRFIMIAAFEQSRVGEEYDHSARCGMTARRRMMVGSNGKYLLIFSCHVDLQQVTVFVVLRGFRSAMPTEGATKAARNFSQKARGSESVGY